LFKHFRRFFPKYFSYHLDSSPNFVSPPRDLVTMATIVPNPAFDADALAEELKAAMKGLGTDDSALVTIITSYSNAQIQELRQSYKRSFGTELLDDVKSETSGNFRKALLALIESRVEFRSRLLHEALSGAGTDIRKLIDVMAPMEADEVEEVKRVYKLKYESDLEQDVKDDTSGNNEKTLVAILAAGRPSSGSVDEDLAASDAQKLYDEGEGKMGTDSAVFRAIFCTRSWAQLGATCKAYNRQRDGGDIEEALKKELSGNTEKLYLAMARHALSPASYFANILKECIDGAGTKDERLIYTLVLQSEENLLKVKREYMTLFGETLAADVAGDTSGHYEKTLLAIINGNA